MPFFSKKRIESVNNEALVNSIKNKAREITPLIDKLGARTSTFWSDFVKNQGVFTVPIASASIDLKNKKIYLERVNRVALEAACNSIQGDIVCEFNNSNTQEPYIHYYYRSEKEITFTHFTKNEKDVDEDKAAYADLLAKKDTIHFQIYHKLPISQLEIEEKV